MRLGNMSWVSYQKDAYDVQRIVLCRFSLQITLVISCSDTDVIVVDLSDPTYYENIMFDAINETDKKLEDGNRYRFKSVQAVMSHVDARDFVGILMANLSRTIVKGKAALVAVPIVARYILVEYVKTQKGNAKSTYEAIATKLLTSGLVRLKLWIFEGMTVTANHLSKDKPSKDEMIKWYIKPVKGTAIDSTGKEVDTLLNVPYTRFNIIKDEDDPNYEPERLEVTDEEAHTTADAVNGIDD